MNEHKSLPLLSENDIHPVPVFSCHVILSVPDESGRRRARVSNLPNLTAIGASEREVLMAIVKQFKSTVQEWTASGQPIPWSETPDQPAPGELERFIPVHL